MGTATERRALPGKARARAFSPAARIDATSRTHADHATRIISWVVRVSARISREVRVSTDQARVPSGGNNPASRRSADLLESSRS
jgi:hypothetical protein